MENIRYGCTNANDEDVVEASNKAHCHEFISQLNQGYESMVGERGIKLSGGQRQRIAIARAILKNAPILIFDEATASLDVHSERHIQVALEELMKDRTVFIIAHRLSTVENADMIMVLDDGEIVETGTHVSLLEKNGVYAGLYRAHEIV